tara:strand:+ start:491 stop:1177 length:687 start_codon:yes stop_codon:yes gene_type:complete
LKPWNLIPINDNGEKLEQIPRLFNFIEPHPYYKLGAPYKNKQMLWSLREGVISRLIKANQYLQSKKKNYSLILYDSWRPIEVQNFMFNLALKNECCKKGLKFDLEIINFYPEIVRNVEKFWAFPSFDKNSPPPHSTGAAIDLTIVDMSGDLLEMGSDIDEMVENSKPDYYENSSSENELLWNERRSILKEVMNKSGFAQHPNEWWHFSYGDQLWAWKNDTEMAIYGQI